MKRYSAELCPGIKAGDQNQSNANLLNLSSQTPFQPPETSSATATQQQHERASPTYTQGRVRDLNARCPCYG